MHACTNLPLIDLVQNDVTKHASLYVGKKYVFICNWQAMAPIQICVPHLSLKQLQRGLEVPESLKYS